MSHKLAKQERQANRQLVHQITINCYANGDISIDQIPANYDTAMKIVGAVQQVVHQKFIIAAMQGKMDKHGNIIADMIKPATPDDVNKILAGANG